MAEVGKCCKCGKLLTVSGLKVTGITIKITADAGCDEEKEEALRQSMGKYPLGEYPFCFECWLDSLLGNSVKRVVAERVTDE